MILLSTKHAAAEVGLSTQGFLYHVRRGHVNGNRVSNGLWTFSPRDIEMFKRRLMRLRETSLYIRSQMYVREQAARKEAKE